MSKKITILTLKEREHLEMRRCYTKYFREYGIASVYLMDPVIVLGKEARLDVHIPLHSSFSLTGKIEKNEWGTYFSILENDAIKEIDQALSLDYVKTGLHLDMGSTTYPFQLSLKEIRIDSIAIAEYDDHFFKIIKKKSLSMGK